MGKSTQPDWNYSSVTRDLSKRRDQLADRLVAPTLTEDADRSDIGELLANRVGSDTLAFDYFLIDDRAVVVYYFDELPVAFMFKLVNAFERGRLLFRLKKFEEAAQFFEEELTRNPESMCCLDLARCYEALQLYESAEANYRRALNRSRYGGLFKSAKLHEEFAHFLEHRGRLRDALDHAKISLREYVQRGSKEIEPMVKYVEAIAARLER